ncbi:MAG: alpha-L-fucosidase [Clostridia bacterium]|nr:alpha-L-fucosidase [Oscillospiraceae bacterium]MBR6747385.1 alpha-L-fucosidase [Clostridia bacterium]
MSYPVITPAPTPGKTDWFQHDRFGMFIHWGTYSLAARHEWVKSREQIDTETYMKYFKHFDPDLYDPKAWAKAAKAAGMKYFIITTKHHEGFCLWDTKYTDYKVTNTPYGKDVLKPMVEAFRAEGLKIGFYHSLLDWFHEDYTVDGCHPMRENEEYIAHDAERDLSRYVDYLHKQTEELMTQFGKIDILWYDFSPRATDRFPGKGRDEWRAEELIKLIRSYQPDIMINDRLQIDQDVKTPEQFQPRGWLHVNGQPVVWEACQTFSGSWGYHRDESTWKSVDMLIRMLVDTVSKGGNLLLNVGPTARGEFDERAIERLEGMGKWMHHNSRSIYGCTQAPAEFQCPQDCRLTYNPETNRLYVHVFAWPFRHLHLDGLAGKVEYAQLLRDGSEIQFVEGKGEAQTLHVTDGGAGTLTLMLPVQQPCDVPVIELFLK